MAKKPVYERLAVIDLKHGLAILQEAFAKNLHRSAIAGYDVNVRSTRLLNFLSNGTSCSCCGLEASFFALEKDAKGAVQRPHLNLRGTTPAGNEVLFVRAHRGYMPNNEFDSMENSETLCESCHEARRKAKV